MPAAVDRTPLHRDRARLSETRPMNGRLLRLGAYLMMGFGSMLTETGPDPARAPAGDRAGSLRCARSAAGEAGPAIERIDALLATAEKLAVSGAPESLAAIGLVHAASVIAATEPAGA